MLLMILTYLWSALGYVLLFKCCLVITLFHFNCILSCAKLLKCISRQRNISPLVLCRTTLDFCKGRAKYFQLLLSQKIIKRTHSKPKPLFLLIVKANCDHMDWKETEQKLVKIDLGIIPIMMKHLCLSSARGKQGYRCSIVSAKIQVESLQHTCCALHDN